MELNTKGVENLSIAIITQAAIDYLENRKRLYKIDTSGRVYADGSRMSRMHIYERMIDAKNFFFSEWYQALTDVDGIVIFEHLCKEFEKWKAGYKPKKLTKSKGG